MNTNAQNIIALKSRTISYTNIPAEQEAKKSGRAAHYQLRVEDVAHLSHLDETTNTYVNTTDLQKLVASVRAKGKSENRLPTLPRLNHQTPAPYRPTATPGDNDTFQGDAVVVRAPMPPPYTASTPPFQPQPHVEPQPVQEVIYSNLEECVAPPRPAPRREPPKTAPPPPPTKEPSSPVSQPVRPAPAPPKSSSPPPTNNSSTPPQTVKPVPPCPSLKPSKVGPAVQAKPGAKPTPPTLPKPGKGKALPPLKMVLRGATEGASSDSCATPDTAIIHLSPEATPTGEGTPGTASISAKIALLEGHMRTAGGGVPRPGLLGIPTPLRPAPILLEAVNYIYGAVMVHGEALPSLLSSSLPAAGAFRNTATPVPPAIHAQQDAHECQPAWRPFLTATATATSQAPHRRPPRCLASDQRSQDEALYKNVGVRKGRPSCHGRWRDRTVPQT
ncbi:hypothetical protein E2C01_041341 [Portunus trituberculatus]|uniref:Uncharacterized protein n=1 Tax=Portunus trituberculatus TaxID=210409 RepID=A0A5B7FJ01_PORTR|nr:hypothetical protein [Portunus trituberculatus]